MIFHEFSVARNYLRPEIVLLRLKLYSQNRVNSDVTRSKSGKVPFEDFGAHKLVQFEK